MGLAEVPSVGDLVKSHACDGDIMKFSSIGVYWIYRSRVASRRVQWTHRNVMHIEKQSLKMFSIRMPSIQKKISCYDAKSLKRTTLAWTSSCLVWDKTSALRMQCSHAMFFEPRGETSETYDANTSALHILYMYLVLYARCETSVLLKFFIVQMFSIEVSIQSTEYTWK